MQSSSGPRRTSREQDIVTNYRDAWELSDATIDELPLDAVGSVWWWGDATVTLHHIMVHVTADTQRHAGHADIVRELIDGSVGLLKGADNLHIRDGVEQQRFRDQLEAGRPVPGGPRTWSQRAILRTHLSRPGVQGHLPWKEGGVSRQFARLGPRLPAPLFIASGGPSVGVLLALVWFFGVFALVTWLFKSIARRRTPPIKRADGVTVLRGGAWIGTWMVSWPFAELQVGPEGLGLIPTGQRTFRARELLWADVDSISTWWSPLGRGLRIRSSTSVALTFWPLRWSQVTDALESVGHGLSATS